MSQLRPLREEDSNLIKYKHLTSPLKTLQMIRDDQHRELIKKSTHSKLEYLTKRQRKVSINAQSYTDLKAAATIYRIPEFSVPQVNFEVADKIKSKVDEIKEEILNHLPQISKSSNYSPRKPEHIVSHRAAVRDLQEWLKVKLKSPPLNYEASIDYKNMIMGIGMRELIRLLNKRCSEEGQMAQEVWELTWGICRQIIIYLSKRAQKCEESLQTEIDFLKSNYEEQFNSLRLANETFLAQNALLESSSAFVRAENDKLTKINEALEADNRSKKFQNATLQEQYKRVLQENLALFLQIGGKNTREWVKKIYNQNKESKTTAYKTQIGSILKQLPEQLAPTTIGKNGSKQLIFSFRQILADSGPAQQAEHPSEQQIKRMIDNIHEEFKQIEREAQTETPQGLDCGTGTEKPTLVDQLTQIEVMVQQVGVDTMQVSQEKEEKVDQKKIKGKKQKQQAVKEKSKQGKQSKDGKDKSKKRQKSDIKTFVEEKSKDRSQSPNSDSIGEQLNRISTKEDSTMQPQKISLSIENPLEDQNQKQNNAQQGNSVQNCLLCDRCGEILFSQQNSRRSSQKHQESLKGRSTQFQKSPAHQKSKLSVFNEESNNAQQLIYESAYSSDEQVPIEVMEMYENDMRQKEGRKRRSSGYVHDIGFKKQMESSRVGSEESVDEEEEQAVEAKTNVENGLYKVSKFKYTYGELTRANSVAIQAISDIPEQLTQNMEHYFELVKEISGAGSKTQMTEKTVVTTIEKGIYPILRQLIKTIKKAALQGSLSSITRNFTSLSTIVYNRMSRKYGMKILAVKNFKILLTAIKQAQKYTDKYKVIELMMFTDCRSTRSEDLFAYLLVLSIMDPTISSPKMTISYEEKSTIQSLCEEHLTKNPKVYLEFERLTKEDIDGAAEPKGLILSELIGAVVTGYRMIKIERIEELGFIFDMLKKDSFMELKTFVYFLNFIEIEAQKRIHIAKRLLQFCDVKRKGKKVGVSESMYSKFLINCPQFTFQELTDSVEESKRKTASRNGSSESSATIMNSQELKQSRISVEQLPKVELGGKKQSDEQSIAVLPDKKSLTNLGQISLTRNYSAFAFQICNFLQNGEQNAYLRETQRSFIKDFLFIYILESEMENLLGVVDYFSSSMFELLSVTKDYFKISHNAPAQLS